MTTLVLEQDPVAANVTVTADQLVVELTDGRTLSVPLSWYPRLLHGTPLELQNWQLLGDGYAIEWPELDEHIGIKGYWPAAAVVRTRRRLSGGWQPGAKWNYRALSAGSVVESEADFVEGHTIVWPNGANFHLEHLKVCRRQHRWSNAAISKRYECGLCRN